MIQYIRKIINRLEGFPYLYYWGPVVLLCLLIFYLSHQSKLPEVPIHIPSLDKIEHLLIYAFLGYLVHRAMVEDEKGKKIFKNPGLYAVLFCLLYGISDEFHQYFIPHRESSGFDLMADAFGGWIGQWIHTNGWISRLFRNIL